MKLHRKRKAAPKIKGAGPVGDLRLFDPRQGDAAFKLEPLRTNAEFSQPQRSNYFTILWLREGKGRFHADLSEFQFQSPALLFFNPYQTFFLVPELPLCGMSLQFHANFFCIETHHEAVGCNGVLFNDIYGQPLVQLDHSLLAEFEQLLSQMELEFHTMGLAHTEVLVSYLKVFLIKATRLKLQQQKPGACTTAKGRPPVLERLIQLIEEDYRNKHAPASLHPRCT